MGSLAAEFTDGPPGMIITCLIAAVTATAAIAGGLDGGVRVGVTGALAAGLAACVLTGLSYGTSHAITPEEPLANDLIFGLALGGVAGIATGLPGGRTAAARRLPWRCLRFLDWAATAGLLRISGIAYQFRHDLLRQHLDPQSRGVFAPRLRP
jgi:hypothetical protein